MPQTLILGASHKPERFAHKAMIKLMNHGHNVVLVANRSLAEIEGHTVYSLADVIERKEPICTVALYVNPSHLEKMAEAVVKLKPSRIIFNPGTESQALQQRFAAAGIKVVEDCVLRMLDGKRY